MGLVPEPAKRRLTVGYHAVVGDAALREDLGGHVVGGAVAHPAVEVGTDHHVAVARQALGELEVELVPAGGMVDQHDARRGILATWACDVGVKGVAAATLVGDDLGADGQRCVSRAGVPPVRGRRLPGTVRAAHAPESTICRVPMVGTPRTSTRRAWR